MKKSTLSPMEQQEHFARVFVTLQEYLDKQNYIAAYVLAFSVLEDRVTAMYITRSRIVKGESESLEQLANVPLCKKIAFLHCHNDIGPLDKQQWVECANKRNPRLHAAMWRLDEFQPADVQSVLECARQADNARKAQKRRLRRERLGESSA